MIKDVDDYNFDILTGKLEQYNIPYKIGADGNDIDNLVPYIRYFYWDIWTEIRDVDKVIDSINNININSKEDLMEFLLKFTNKLYK
jgi:hypothetical protein